MINFIRFLLEGKKEKTSTDHTVTPTKEWRDFKKSLSDDDPIKSHMRTIEELLARKAYAGPKVRPGQAISNDQYLWQSKYNAHSIEESNSTEAKKILRSLGPNETWVQGHFPGTPGLKGGRYVWGAILGKNKDGSTYAIPHRVASHQKAAE